MKDPQFLEAGCIGHALEAFLGSCGLDKEPHTRATQISSEAQVSQHGGLKAVLMF